MGPFFTIGMVLCQRYDDGINNDRKGSSYEIIKDNNDIFFLISVNTVL
jgi:hypothetical protein